MNACNSCGVVTAVAARGCTVTLAVTNGRLAVRLVDEVRCSLLLLASTHFGGLQVSRSLPPRVSMRRVGSRPRKTRTEGRYVARVLPKNRDQGRTVTFSPRGREIIVHFSEKSQHHGVMPRDCDRVIVIMIKKRLPFLFKYDHDGSTVTRIAHSHFTIHVCGPNPGAATRE